MEDVAASREAAETVTRARQVQADGAGGAAGSDIHQVGRPVVGGRRVPPQLPARQSGDLIGGEKTAARTSRVPDMGDARKLEHIVQDGGHGRTRAQLKNTPPPRIVQNQ
eukprot:7356825-Prorocentrum_lima.AAC.1